MFGGPGSIWWIWSDRLVSAPYRARCRRGARPFLPRRRLAAAPPGATPRPGPQARSDGPSARAPRSGNPPRVDAGAAAQGERVGEGARLGRPLTVHVVPPAGEAGSRSRRDPQDRYQVPNQARASSWPDPGRGRAGVPGGA